MLFRDTTILNSRRLLKPRKLESGRKGRKMVVTIVVRPDHYKEGNIRGTKNDPIALAIREKLNDDKTKHFACSVIADEILLVYQGSEYDCEFDADHFHSHWQGIPRHLTLKFKPMFQKG